MDGELYFYVRYRADSINNISIIKHVNTRTSKLLFYCCFSSFQFLKRKKESSEISFKFFYSCTEKCYREYHDESQAANKNLCVLYVKDLMEYCILSVILHRIFQLTFQKTNPLPIVKVFNTANMLFYQIWFSSFLIMNLYHSNECIIFKLYV